MENDTPFAVSNSTDGFIQIIFESVISRQIYLADQKRFTTPKENYLLIMRHADQIFTNHAIDVFKSYMISAPIPSIVRSKISFLGKMKILCKHLIDYTIVFNKRYGK